MSCYLVTGGGGFIGSHLVDALLADGHAVRVVDDLSTGSRANVDPSRLDLRVADLRDPATVAAAAAGVDGIFHLAAIASVVRCNEAWLDTHAVNLTATLRLFDAARRGPVPMVYASSAAVYGDRADACAETDRLSPLSSYGADKAACELHAGAAARVHGVPSFGLRFFNVYGPRQRPDDAYAGVISIFKDRIARGLPLTIYGDGEQSRDFVFVADVVRALRRAMTRLEEDPAPRAEISNVGTGRPTTVNELARALMMALGREVPLAYAAPRAGDIRMSLADVNRMRDRLGLEAATTLLVGLRELIDGSSP
jgi:UDP-glucose 4-epimerase